MAFETIDPNEDPSDHFREFMGPGAVDRTLRQALQFCWMALPEERRNVDEAERQFRRIVERVLKDFREDADAFC